MKIQVLLCDDASFIRDLIKRSLRKHLPQVEITEANDGKKAQSLLGKQSFDLILSDWEMPQVSGEELLQWVRAHEKHADTPFVMITSLGEKQHIVKAVQAGVSDYLGKPFTGEELLQKVRKQLAKAGKLESAAAAPSISGGGAFSSAELLNTGRKDPAASSPEVQTSGRSRDSGRIKGTALLRGEGEPIKCMVKSANMEEMLLVMKKTAAHPQLLEKVSVDIAPAQGSDRLDDIPAWVHGLSVVQKQAASDFFNITLRFSDLDAGRKEKLSRFVLEADAV